MGNSTDDDSFDDDGFCNRLFNTSTASLPQDPFLPQQEPLVPTFLDTQGCLCQMQTDPSSADDSGLDPDADKKTFLWQCVGNQTGAATMEPSGKWYKTRDSAEGTDADLFRLPVNSAAHPLDAATPMTWDLQSKSFVKLSDGNNKDSRLSVWDAACTGENRTEFSTSFYQANEQLESNQDPTAAAPCWRSGAVPVQIQNVSDWQTTGCLEGFMCVNNTVNSLPQYCPPIQECQLARLASTVCQLNGSNVGMGPFEPVVCQAGRYCPPSGNGTVTRECPAGTYCQAGVSTPTPCTGGSRCPPGSTYQLFLVPVGLLVALDVLLVVGTLLLRHRRRLKASARGHGVSSLGFLEKQRASASSSIAAVIAGHRYKRVQDETGRVDEDGEMGPVMNATYVPGRQDTWSGFEAALDIPEQPVWSPIDVLNSPEAGLTPEIRAFVSSMSKATDAADFGLSFGFSELTFQPKGSQRPILQGVTGEIRRGTLTAVMGGSGAGKSTFVNVLMGKSEYTAGSVTINGAPGKLRQYKKVVGYVPQDDVVLPELTVRENLLHSARVRLPRTWKDADICAHVTAVIDCLELSHVSDSLVGSASKPILSGGQRKRVSIGMELAAAPMAIFLDEPTSGLDATAATSIMRTLKALARLGISVIVVIHQPRMEIFDMLDDLILLANGQLIYAGREADVQPFFEQLGFHFPPHANYGDVVTDIITGNGRPYKKTGDISKDALIGHWSASRQGSHGDDRTMEATVPQTHANMQRLLRRRGAPLWRQTQLCFARAMLQQYRAVATFWYEMCLATLAGFLLGLAEHAKQGVLFTGSYRGAYSILSVSSDLRSAPELALLVAIAVGLVGAAPGVRVFSEELLLHRREAEAGHSRLAYFAAKSAAAAPRMACACLHFTAPLLLLSAAVVPWGVAFPANLLYFYCVYGLASVVSMVVRREDAPLFATMLSLIVGILSGAAPPLRTVKGWHVEWLWRASPGVWLAELYFGQLVGPFAYLYDVEQAADASGFALDHLWRNLGVLAAIGTLYRVLAFAGLFAGKRIRM
ncbi:hypothetical protein B0T24DRAFT_701328 [Lasiosphaeria ovina]|uniref:ABC transporter domain-containing protein n=1 Tax=Lasiosphaeria ovina TaxID=92902 RepID=A0AAE0KJ14_9PEZI|nr:hypothetical protein B0T24DRAFT_701328 [Lasiosphaeria ovina]